MRINSNIAALNAQRQLGLTTRALNRALERLSSGKRINSSRDDASGLAIATNLESQVRGLKRASQNINEANSWLMTADGVLATQTELIHRMRELALQASQGTLSATDRSSLNGELSQLLAEFERVSQETTFNGVSLLDGTLDSMTIQAGARKDDTIEVSIGDLRADSVFTHAQGLGTFASATTTETGTASKVLSADLDHDGNQDIIALNTTDDTISVHWGRGDGTYDDRTTIATDSNARDIALVDLDADGRVDLVTADGASRTISLFLNQGNGQFSARTTYATELDSNAVASGDFNGDGDIDIASAESSGLTLRVSTFFGNGSGSLATRVTANAGVQSAAQMEVADFNGDSIDDLLIRGASAGSIRPILSDMTGTSWTAGGLISTVGATLHNFSSIDFDRDGDMDVVSSATGLAAVTRVQVHLNDGTGTVFTGGSTFATTATNNNTTGGITVEDFNGDGLYDIASSLLSGELSVLLATSLTTFSTYSSTVLPATGVSLNNLIATDIDNDGVKDLVTEGSQGIITLLTLTQQVSATHEVDISTVEQAQNLLSILDRALENILSTRSRIGAQQNRLSSALNSTLTTQENLDEARSNVIDADIASEIGELTRYQIQQQAITAVMGQANLQLATVMQLLRF